MKFDKILERHHKKFKWTIQNVYAHARNLHVALYSGMRIKFFDAEEIIITLLILQLSHFNGYIFVQKNTRIQIYK